MVDSFGDELQELYEMAQEALMDDNTSRVSQDESNLRELSKLGVPGSGTTVQSNLSVLPEEELESLLSALDSI